jgi:hypothetical protein
MSTNSTSESLMDDSMQSLIPYNNSSENSYSDPILVLTRVVVSVMNAISLTEGLDAKTLLQKLFVFIPKGTVFTRTCKTPVGKNVDPNKSGGFCGFDLAETTTFANISPLGNLTIRNSSKQQQNDSVVFLRTLVELQFINFTLISQIIGVQIKSGIGPKKAKDSRGIFSACCPLAYNQMVDFCKIFNCDGIIQTDSVDGMVFYPETDKTHVELAIKAVYAGAAFPQFSKDNMGKDIIDEVIFPEFSFHSEKLFEKMEYINVENKDGIIDELFRYGNPLFRLQNTRFENPVNINGALIDVFDLNHILKDKAAHDAYLNFQLDTFTCTPPPPSTDTQSYIRKYQDRSALVKRAFPEPDFAILPHLIQDSHISDALFIHFCRILTSNTPPVLDKSMGVYFGSGSAKKHKRRCKKTRKTRRVRRKSRAHCRKKRKLKTRKRW